MLRRTYLLLILTTALATVYAQEANTIFTIDGQNIYAGEFERDFAYRLPAHDTAGLYSLMQEYADYRVMAAEAQHQRMDTTAQYANAIQYIRHSLLRGHIAGSPSARKAIAGMADHSQYQYNVAYIRIDIFSNSHGDTSAAYTKAQTAISRIKNGTPFETVARQISDAPDTKINGGYLGWVSPIDFKAGEPVCNYIYSHYADGESISRPVRSGSSYYVIKLGGRRAAIDSVSVSPLIIRKRNSARFNDSIRGLFATLDGRIKSGVDFGAIQYEYSDVKHSQKLSLSDAYSKYSTHLLDSATAGMCTQVIETGDYMLIARIDSVFQLTANNDYTARIAERIPGTETYREAYKNFLDSIRGISDYSSKGGLGPIYRLMPDSSIFEAQWNPGDLRHLSGTLLTFGGQSYSYADFATYIYQNQYATGYSKIPEYVQMRYSEYLDALTLQEAYKYLTNSDNTYKREYQRMTCESYAGMLKSSRGFPHGNADSADVIRYYRENGRQLKTGHTLAIRMYNYQTPANRKKTAKTVEAMANGENISDPALSLTMDDTLQLGQNSLADRIISGFDSGRYHAGRDRIIYLDNINSVAIVSVLKTPEELPKSEIFQIVLPDYYKNRHQTYMQRLRNKHQLKISPDAYNNLAACIYKQQ